MKKNKSRIFNSIKNFIFGLGCQIIISVITFISRTVFIKVLGMEYLGINGVFASVLSVLSLAELGFGNIVVFSLYKPIREKNHEKISALILFYKSIYLKISFSIAGIGVLLIPLLPKMVNTNEPLKNITVYYLLFLTNTVISYLYVYKTSLIRADQRQYIISKYTMFLQIIITTIQVVTLLMFKNYILYLILQILCTFFINYLLSRKADKLYPFLKKRGDQIDSQQKNIIYSDVKAMFSYRIGGIILNSTDNIFISVLVNTVSVGIYSNYTLIITFVNQFINMGYDALYNSVGDLNAGENDSRKKEVFQVLVFGFLWIACIGFVCLHELITPFIILWFGKDAVLTDFTVIAICINFYLPIILYPVWMYRNTSGLFKETKRILLYTAALNFILSYVLGYKFGISGILSATFIARLLTSFWFEPYILYKKAFDGGCVQYFYRQFEGVAIVMISILTINIVTKNLVVDTFPLLIFKAFICLLFANMLFIGTMCKRKEFIYLKELLFKGKKGRSK